MVAGVGCMRMYDMITHALHGEDRCAVAIYNCAVMVLLFTRGWVFIQQTGRYVALAWLSRFLSTV